MRPTVAFAAFGLALLAVLAVPAMGIAPTADQVDDGDEPAPGEQFAGVVGVQGAELDGDIDQRAFAVQFAEAADNETRADVVAQRVGDVDERLAELRERKDRLDTQREAGEIPEGKYRAQMATVTAEIRLLSRAANQTEHAAAGLPPGLLGERGVGVDAIQRLQQNASELSGPEVAEIARGIAGPGVGEPPGHANETGPPPHAGGPSNDDRPGNDRAEGNQSGGANGNSGPPDDAGPGDRGGDGDGSDSADDEDEADADE